MKKTLLLFTIAISLSVFSQTASSDFLIKTNGDTIRGKFKYKSSKGDIKTKIAIKVNDTLKLNLKASEVKYFREGKNEFITFQIEGEKDYCFLKIWTLGKYLELFEWQAPLSFSGGSKIEYTPYIRKTENQGDGLLKQFPRWMLLPSQFLKPD